MRRSYPAVAATGGDPIHGINTTPLIDVMLVLLVMFIITIPIMNHEVPVDLPQPGPAPGELVEHRLEIGRGGLVRLDGVAVAAAALPGRLAAIRDDPAALLAVHTDPEARYETFAQTLATVKRARITRLAFVGHAELMRSPGLAAGK